MPIVVQPDPTAASSLVVLVEEAAEPRIVGVRGYHSRAVEVVGTGKERVRIDLEEVARIRLADSVGEAAGHTPELGIHTAGEQESHIAAGEVDCNLLVGREVEIRSHDFGLDLVSFCRQRALPSPSASLKRTTS